MAFNEDKTITITFRGKTTDLDNKVSNIDRMIKVLKYDTQAYQKQMKFGDDYAKQMELYSSAISNVDEEIRLAYNGMYEWEDEMNKYSQILQENGNLTNEEWQHFNRAMKGHAEDAKMIANLKEQYKRLTYEKENYNRLSVADELTKEGTEIKNLGTNVGKVADSFKYFSLAAGAALTGSTMAAVNFESAMANVNKVLKDSEKGYFDSLQQQILDMSREIPLTAEEIAQVTANALQLGVSAKDVGKFTETILKLGTATNISADEAAIALAQFFNITGESLGNVDKFGAVLTSLGNQFPTFESDIMDMATRIAAAGTSIGMSSQDILGLSTALTSVGLNAEAGGSAISQILRTIDTQVATSGKKLRAWAEQAGMSVDEFKRAWSEDATGTFQLLVNSLADGVDNGENLNAMLKDLGVTAIRQTDAFSRLVQANDTLNDALGESAKSWEEIEKGESGALNDEFAEKVKTLASQFQLLKNQLFDLGVNIGQILMPYLQSAITFVRSLVDWFLELSPAAKKWIAGFLVGIASVYPVLKGVSKVLELFGTNLIGLGKAIATKLLPSGFGEAFFATVRSGFMGMVKSIAAPIAIIGTLVATFARLYKTSDEFKLAIDGLASAFGGRLIATTGELMYYLKEFWNWLGSKIMPLMDKLKQLYETFIEPALAYLYTAIFKLVFDVIADCYRWIVKLVEYCINFLKPIIEVVIGLIKAVSTFLAPIIGWLIRLIGVVVELVDYVWNKAKPYIEEVLEKVGNAIEWLSGIASDFFGIVLEALQYALDKLSELWAYLKDTGVVTRFGDAFTAIIGPIKEVFNWIKKVVDKINEWAGAAPTINEMMGNAGYRFSGTTVYNTNNITQKNTVNGVNPSSAQKLADDVLSLVNNGIGKQLDARGW